MNLFKKWNKQSLIKKIIEIISFVIIVIFVILGINKLNEYNELRKIYVFKDRNYNMLVENGNYAYNYNFLNENQKSLYKSFHKEMNKFIKNEKELDIEDSYYILGRFRYVDYKITKEEASNTISAFCHDFPSFYYIVSSKALIKEDMICPIIEEEYIDDTYREKLSMEMSYNVFLLMDKIRNYENDYDKFLEIYNYVIDNSEYERDEFGKNSKANHANNIVGVLDNDDNTNSICQGFAKALAFLSNVAGIKCLTVGSDKINHMYNIVLIEGRWYYADSTNDNKENDSDYFLCGEIDYWLHFDSNVPLNNNSLSKGISWQADLPEISKESYIRK